MSDNLNNHLTTSLSWTKYESVEKLPKGQIVFRSNKGKANVEEGHPKGRTQKWQT